jgi:hypothetical protein
LAGHNWHLLKSFLRVIIPRAHISRALPLLKRMNSEMNAFLGGCPDMYSKSNGEYTLCFPRRLFVPFKNEVQEV